MSTTTEQLEELFKAKKYDKAKAVIESYFDDATTEKGKDYFMITTLYLELINNINAKYKLLLQETLEDLQSINLVEKKLDEQDKLNSVRKGLQ
jgi:hypothetical protein